MEFARQEYWSGLPLPSIPRICKYYFKEKCHCRYDSIKTLDIGSYPNLPEWALKTIASVLIREKQMEFQHYIQMKAEVHVVKAMVFPVVMYGCESWTVKKAEHWRTDAFELWCWRRLLRVPWTARRSNQSILKKSVLNILWKNWCWSWNSNILDTWWEEPTHWKRPWCWKRLKAGREGDNRGWDGWMVWQTEFEQFVHEFEQFWELGMDREAWHVVVHDVSKSQTRLSNRTELNKWRQNLEWLSWERNSSSNHSCKRQGMESVREPQMDATLSTS